MNLALARQTERIRSMTADEKVRLSHELWMEARRLVAAGVSASHSDWPDLQIAARVREIMSDAGA
jgi:hypothetical protein